MLRAAEKFTVSFSHTVIRIDMTYQADTFFEDLDESPDWEMVEEGDEQTCFDIEFYFTEYRRKNEKAERPR